MRSLILNLAKSSTIIKAYEFPAKVTSEGKLEVPDALRKYLPSDRAVKVIVLFKEPAELAEEEAWSTITSEQFLAGYNPADAIYDRSAAFAALSTLKTHCVRQ